MRADPLPTRRRRLLVTALVVFVWAGRPFADDWNFTPADFGNLTSDGGDLELHADSAWLPDAVRDNLIKTLKKLLDPNLDPPSTAGVNVSDFYHAHVVCPRPCAEELLAARSDMRRTDEADELKVLGYRLVVTNGNLERFIEIKRQAEARARDFIVKFYGKDCAVIYHTYETNSPRGMSTDDPRRNIITPREGEPRGLTEQEASRFLEDWCVLTQIAFLIDEEGKVHVTTGTTFDLSKVIGSPVQ
jgi:hypothetical protein